MTNGGPCSSTSPGFCSTHDPDISYSKTSRAYLVTDLEKLSRPSLGFSPGWGIAWNGRCLTARTTAYRSHESGSSLLDTLEESPGDRYFHSESTLAAKSTLTLRGVGMVTEYSVQQSTTPPPENGSEPSGTD